MPLFTIETTYRMPYYRQRTYDAATIEDACHLAMKDDDWDSEKPDYECPGETYVTDIWPGTIADYDGNVLPIPSQFHGMRQRQVDHFGELVELLEIVARPMGIAQVDFERWLPRAQAALAKAKAIIERRKDPDEPRGDGEEQGR